MFQLNVSVAICLQHKDSPQGQDAIKSGVSTHLKINQPTIAYKWFVGT